MSETKDPKDRFLMPERTLQAAIEGHRSILRAGMYVPTREEMETWPSQKLYGIVMDWMWESPSEIIPNNDQITEVLSILEARPDAEEHRTLIAECREFLKI